MNRWDRRVDRRKRLSHVSAQGLAFLWGGRGTLWVRLPTDFFTATGPSGSPRSLEVAHQFFHVLQFLAQQIELARQSLDLRFGAAVDRVIQLATQAVLDVLPVLAHHD